MLHAAWKSLLGRKVRLMMSALSIVLGVAFVAGSLIFTNLLNDSFSQILKSAIADVNVSADLQSGMAATSLRIDSANHSQLIRSPPLRRSRILRGCRIRRG